MQTQAQNLTTRRLSLPRRAGLLSKVGDPCPLFRLRKALTVLTFGANELLFGHKLQAETLHVKDAATLALAGHQRLARALADLNRQRAHHRTRASDTLRHKPLPMLTKETGWHLFRAKEKQESWPASHGRAGKSPGWNQSRHFLHLALLPAPAWTEMGQALLHPLGLLMFSRTWGARATCSLFTDQETGWKIPGFSLQNTGKFSLCPILKVHLESWNGAESSICYLYLRKQVRVR